MFTCVQDQINSRVDLVMRMADEKWRLAGHAYDRLDVNIRRLDADLGRMEVRACVPARGRERLDGGAGAGGTLNVATVPLRKLSVCRRYRIACTAIPPTPTRPARRMVTLTVTFTVTLTVAMA